MEGTTLTEPLISTHAPAGGATRGCGWCCASCRNFYSRPCGRGDEAARRRINERIEFLLTPLREGRPDAALQTDREDWISTHAPAGGATRISTASNCWSTYFYSRPCGRGDLQQTAGGYALRHFYSRPCGRGDSNFPQVRHEVLRQIAER